MQVKNVHKGDVEVRCPHCSIQDKTRLQYLGQCSYKETEGRINLVSDDQALYRCDGCSTVFNFIPSIYNNSLKILTYSPPPVSSNLKPDNNSVTNVTPTVYISDGSINVSNQYEVVDKLEKIINALYNMNSQLIDIVTQNHNLMEKLVNDPLALTRKNVSDFDLK